MTKINHNPDLFSPSGCLTLEAIQLFQSDSLNAVDKELVENHLSECVICNNAMEGYLNLPDQNEQTDTILKIRGIIRNKYLLPAVKAHRSKTGRLPGMAYISAAASILILLGIFWILRPGVFHRRPIMADNITETKAESLNIVTGIEGRPTETIPTYEMPVKKEIIVDQAEIFTVEVTEEPEVVPGGVTGEEVKGNPEVEERIAAKEDLIVLVDEEAEKEFDEIQVHQDDTFVVDVGHYADKAKFVSATEVAGKGTKALQVDNTPAGRKKTVRSPTDSLILGVDKDEIFMDIDEMPEFSKKGYRNFDDFIRKNLKYPAKSRENGIMGQVFVQFIVDPKGKVKNAKVIHGIDSALDNEALRVVSSSPQWKPGKQNGKKVAVKIIHPVEFKLDD